ncbi:MAG: sigma-70 family RNA polymerase sigma factor [Steroidobacteraceae bacterium]
MRPSLLKYFMRKTGSAAEAEDLTQDVLVRVLARAGWKSPEEARGYIFRAAVNRWRDRRRRQATHGTTVQWDEETAVKHQIERAQSWPERVLIAREDLDRTLQALEDMSERTRMVLVLIRLEQMKVATVAEMLGISVSAVNKHLAKGLSRLAELRRQDAE